MSKSQRFFIAISLLFVVFAIVIGGTLLMKTGNGKGVRQVQKRSLFSRVDNELLGFLVLARSKANEGQGQPSGQRTTPEKVERVLRRNKGTVTIQAIKRLKSNTVFIGYMVPKGYKKSDKCVVVRFAMAVILRKQYLSAAKFSSFLGLTENETSGEGLGNVITTYPNQFCKNTTDHLDDIGYAELFRIQKQIRTLMPGLHGF